VTRPVLRSDAENAVKRIEGVEHFENDIEVLPPSSMDQRLRLRLYRAIYGYPALQKYSLGVSSCQFESLLRAEISRSKELWIVKLVRTWSISGLRA
jgi:hypothetical protein